LGLDAARVRAVAAAAVAGKALHGTTPAAGCTLDTTQVYCESVD
jgi:hypothetical protein